MWNLWLGASLTRAELPSVCPALLQVGSSGRWNKASLFPLLQGRCLSAAPVARRTQAGGGGCQRSHDRVRLQGMAASSNFTDSHGVAFNVALVSRRSCLHPGMRYKARGLNALAGPGNECEVDQLVWKCSAPGELRVLTVLK